MHPESEFAGQREHVFNTTHWSVVLKAGDSRVDGSEAALETLCVTYWYPIYAFVRRKGHSPHDAQDLTQDFFARILDKKYFKLAAQERGKFRSFLLKSLSYFLINDWVRGQAKKRGGGQVLLSLDHESAERNFQQEPAVELPPESLYDKTWALALLERAMEKSGADYAAAGKGELFGQLKCFLLNEGSAEAYREVALSMNMEEGAVRVAAHRLRQRFRETVRAEIAQTVATPAEIDEELRCLISALSA